LQGSFVDKGNQLLKVKIREAQIMSEFSQQRALALIQLISAMPLNHCLSQVLSRTSPLTLESGKRKASR
jgi:hypothetical protein